MNDYGFDYLNYITNVPNQVNYDSNQMNYNFPMNYMNDNQQKINIMNNVNNNNNQILDPNQGFMRGNLFANLYDPYKNYQPEELNPKNEKEALLYQVMQYKFALKDLNLYLDIYPNDTNVINLYHKYLAIEKQICDKYENMYGPLTVDSPSAATNAWNWQSSPWPWEVK